MPLSSTALADALKAEVVNQPAVTIVAAPGVPVGAGVIPAEDTTGFKPTGDLILSPGAANEETLPYTSITPTSFVLGGVTASAHDEGAGLTVDGEAAAIEAWGNALVTYFSDAVAGAIPITGVAAAKPIITGALAGLSAAAATPADGAVKIQAPFVAFWADVVLKIGVYFPGTIIPAAPPPLVGTIAAAITPILTANKDGALSIDASLDALAAAIHPLNLNGTATLPGPPQVPVLIT